MLLSPGSKMGLYSSFRRKPESICALGSGLRRNDGQNTLPIYQFGIRAIVWQVGIIPSLRFMVPAGISFRESI